jgi:hemolysin activation/secretion protein
MIATAGSTRLHFDNDSSIHRYEYDKFKYNEKGTSFSLFYSNADRFYVGLGYEWTKQQWRKEPFGFRHSIDLRYSFTQHAVSFTYKGTVTKFVGNWDLNLFGNYDLVRWTNFYGIGNDTKMTGDRDYHIMRTKEAIAQVGLTRNIGKRSRIDVSGFFQTVQIIQDKGKFVGQDFFNGGPKHLYDQRQFIGGSLTYDYLKVDDPLTPQRGIDFTTTASYTYNLYSHNNVGKYTANLNLYIPIVRNLVIAVRSGGGVMTGKSEFYQLNSLGGGRSLRGYRRDRFRGESVLFSDQELQWLFDVKTRVFNGKFGLIGLYDVGRVWQPGEVSNTWHTGYGGGILLAPFNKISFSVTYAVSNELTRFHFRCAKPLFSTPKISK